MFSFLFCLVFNKNLTIVYWVHCCYSFYWLWSKLWGKVLYFWRTTYKAAKYKSGRHYILGSTIKHSFMYAHCCTRSNEHNMNRCLSRGGQFCQWYILKRVIFSGSNCRYSFYFNNAITMVCWNQMKFDDARCAWRVLGAMRWQGWVIGWDKLSSEISLLPTRAHGHDLAVSELIIVHRLSKLALKNESEHTHYVY